MNKYIINFDTETIKDIIKNINHCFIFSYRGIDEWLCNIPTGTRAGYC